MKVVVAMSPDCLFATLMLLLSWSQLALANNLMKGFGFGALIDSPDPCIRRRIIQAGAAKCESVVLPAGFCQTCGVNIDIDSEGNYVNCLYLSGLEALDGTINQQCVSKFEEYVEMNPCDNFRAGGLRRYKAWTNPLVPFQKTMLRKVRNYSRQIMDAFIYALCELPCDCIPQYDADVSIPQQNFNRGNCQGHAQIDLCAVLPNIKLISGQESNLSMPAIEELPYVCPKLDAWRADHPGEWFNMTPTTVEENVATFLDYVLDATEITRYTNTSENPLWQQCFYLENTQKRIIPI